MKVRLDTLLVERGLAPTRAKAQALVLAGSVSSAGRRLEKPGASVDGGIELVVAPGRRFVSRGAEKLGPILAAFGVDPAGRDALDVGASTGGFTETLLAAGAHRVIALDVGHGQLDWGLRNDPRVVVLEGINARYLDPATLPFRPSLAVVDVSFISLRQVLPPVQACLAPGAEIVALIKPQFEVGRGGVGRGGIVRDPARWSEVLDGMAGFTAERGLSPQAVLPSPIRGARGNVEFFVHLRPGTPSARPETLNEQCRRAIDAVAAS